MAALRSVKISGKKFAKLWDESLLSIDGFAEKFGMKRSRVHQFTRPGTHNLLRGNLSKAAARLGISADDLLKKIGADAGETGPKNGDKAWDRLFAAVNAVAATTKLSKSEVLTEARKRLKADPKKGLIVSRHRQEAESRQEAQPTEP